MHISQSVRSLFVSVGCMTVSFTGLLHLIHPYAAALLGQVPPPGSGHLPGRQLAFIVCTLQKRIQKRGNGAGWNCSCCIPCLFGCCGRCFVAMP
jgi:hypothetical protein